MEKLNQQIVSDHVSFLAEHELKERIKREELECLVSSNLQMRRAALICQQRETSVKDKARQAYISDTEDIQRQFCDQDRKQQKAIQEIKKQYNSVSTIYKGKCQQMEAAIEKEQRKVDVEERRRNCEIEGVQADLQNMNRKVDFYKKYIGKLKQLVSDDGAKESAMEDEFNQIKEEASEMEQSPQHPHLNPVSMD